MSEQTRLFSLIEVITGRVLGYASAVLLQLVVLPFYGFDVTLVKSFQIAALFTGTSMILSFLIRRLFNYLQKIGIGVEKDDNTL